MTGADRPGGAMIGSTISHYRILAQLGEGGMGVVYRAQDLVLERLVALKVLRPETVGDESRRQRFLQEARSAAALNHPSIATIFEANEVDSTLFIAMEFIEGESLRQRLARGPLPLADAVRMATEVARGLAHAHAQRVVHRDLKPENIMLGPQGQAKILDFGLAKILREPAAGTEGASVATMTMALTFHGQVMGTPAYMSPEQARGQTLDFRSDQFSFGAMLREMLTGIMTFQGPSPADTVSAVLSAQPPPPSQIDVRLPPQLDRIVDRCLQKDPAARYADTTDLARDLEALEPRTAAAGRVAVRRVQRAVPRRLAFGAAALAVVAAVLLVWRPWSTGGRSRPPAGAAVADAAASRPNWILVADFEGTGVDADLRTATRELVTASLAQSNFVTPIGRAQVLRGLRLANRPDTTRVRGELARELAYRAAARTYVEGRIDKVLTGYSLVLAVNDAETGNAVVTVNQVAEGDAEVIGTLDRLVRKLREKLGEKSSAVRSTGRGLAIITPSFEAYRDYARALELQRHREYAASNQVLHAAVGRDSAFASAWKAIGANYNNMGYLDSAQTAFDTALRYPDRLTENERLGLQIFVAYVVRYDLQKALDLYDALVRETTFNADNFNNRGTVLFALGRYEEALASQQRAAEVSPFGPSELQLLNQHHTQVQTGMLDEARVVEARLTEANQLLARLELAVSTEEWAQAESLATGLAAGAPGAAMRFQAGLVLASLRARSGAVEAASEAMTRLLVESPQPFWSDLGRMALVQLDVVRGMKPDLGATLTASDTSTAEWIVRGIAAAAGRDSATARRCLAAVRRKPAAERRRFETDTKLLEGWMEAGAGHWDEVVSLLDSPMTAGQGPWFTGRLPIRWLVAQAQEKSGNLEQAAQAYELVLSPERLHHDAWTWRAALQPFAHQRLAILYMRLDKRAEAEKNAQAFREALDPARPQPAPARGRGPRRPPGRGVTSWPPILNLLPSSLSVSSCSIGVHTVRPITQEEFHVTGRDTHSRLHHPCRRRPGACQRGRHPSPGGGHDSR